MVGSENSGEFDNLSFSIGTGNLQLFTEMGFKQITLLPVPVIGQGRRFQKLKKNSLCDPSTSKLILTLPVQYLPPASWFLGVGLLKASPHKPWFPAGQTWPPETVNGPPAERHCGQ